MEAFSHDLRHLFKQLGLPNGQAEIDDFISKHKLESHDPALPEAAFWNQAQASFLRENIVQDSDWAEVTDQLDALLRN